MSLRVDARCHDAWQLACTVVIVRASPCRLEDAVMSIVASGDKSLVTPDIGGTGTTKSFTNAVIKSMKP